MVNQLAIPAEAEPSLGRIELLYAPPFALSLSKGSPFFGRVFDGTKEEEGFDRLSPNGFV